MSAAEAGAAERAATAYVRAAMERDPALRAALLETCFAEHGRLVARGRTFHGRAEVAAMIARVHADPSFVRIRLASAIDAAGTTFRFRSFIDFRDGTSQEFFDAGELDEHGRIATLLVFTGPLGDSA